MSEIDYLRKVNSAEAGVYEARKKLNILKEKLANTKDTKSGGIKKKISDVKDSIKKNEEELSSFLKYNELNFCLV